MFARTALQAQDNLLRRLRLLVEHRLGLATVPRLFGIVTTLPCVRCANRASSRQSRVSTRRIRFTRASSRASHPRHRSSARAIARVDRHRRRVFAPRTLRVQARLARLVLRHLVRGVLLAPLAERLLRFRHLFAFARIGSVVVVSHHRLERDRSRALTRARPAPSHRARARRVARRAAASNASSASPSSRRTFTIFSTPRARQRGVTRRRARAICRARDGHLLNPGER